MDNEIMHMSATELVFKIKTKEVSSTEVVRAYLKQIEDVNPIINAVVQIDAECALTQARKVDDAIIQGCTDGQLLGLPITVKNSCHVLGFSPDKGCAGLVGNPSTYDATVVARMRKEGAIVLGLTNTPELTLGFETDNLVYGKTLNPYNLLHTPGGSSGGEAAIIAAGGSPLGIASDGGGSIRLPAHYSGIVGMRATQGRIPFTGNIPIDGAGLFSQFISFGPMARYVRDICLTLPILVGPDGRDPHAVPVPLGDHHDVSLSALRVAFYTDDSVSRPTAETISTIQHAVNSLSEHVQEVTEDTPEVLQHIYGLFNESIFLGGDNGDWLVEILNSLSIETPSPLLMEFLALAKACQFSVTDLRKRWVEFDHYRMRMLAFLEPYDVLICPVSATPAKRHGTSFKEIQDVSYVMAHTLTGWPAIVIPAGISEDGLPIGIQILAKPWRDDVVLAVATLLEKKLGGWRAPSLFEIDVSHNEVI